MQIIILNGVQVCNPLEFVFPAGRKLSLPCVRATLAAGRY